MLSEFPTNSPGLTILCSEHGGIDLPLFNSSSLYKKTSPGKETSCLKLKEEDKSISVRVEGPCSSGVLGEMGVHGPCQGS